MVGGLRNLKVLLGGRDLGLERGIGIATYARNLAACLQDLAAGSASSTSETRRKASINDRSFVLDSAPSAVGSNGGLQGMCLRPPVCSLAATKIPNTGPVVRSAGQTLSALQGRGGLDRALPKDYADMWFRLTGTFCSIPNSGQHDIVH